MDHRPWPFSFEHCDLLAKRENLQSNIGPAAEEDPNHGQDGENAMKHEITVITQQDGLRPQPGRGALKSFILRAYTGFVYPQRSRHGEAR
jgi:hypothetical protein